MVKFHGSSLYVSLLATWQWFMNMGDISNKARSNSHGDCF